MDVSFYALCRRNGEKYLIMVLWLIGCMGLFYRDYRYYRDDPRFYYVHQMLGRWMCISRGSAAILNLNCGLILLPMCRYILTILRSCNKQIQISTINTLIDSCKGFHIACAVIIAMTTVVHFIGHMFNDVNFSRYYNDVYIEVNGAEYSQQDPVFIAIRSVAGITGLLMCVILVVIVTTSYRHMREVNYDLFCFTHRLILVFYILILVHAIGGSIKQQTNLNNHWPGCNTSSISPQPEPITELYLMTSNITNCTERPRFEQIKIQSWYWIGIPLFIYVCDSTVRIFRRGKGTLKVEGLKSYPGGVVEVNMTCDGFKATPGQYILLKCSSISYFEWHPFSITQCPRGDSKNFSVHIRTTGDWSGKLQKTMDGGYSSEDRFSVNIDGPYTSPLCRMNQSKIAVCIAGGIGVTPFIAFLDRLRFRSDKLSRLKKVYFIWINRDRVNITWFIDGIINTHRALCERNELDILDVQLYITRPQTQIPTIHQTLPRGGVDFIDRRLHLKKPNWSEIFSNLSELHKSKKVDVFVCGPRSLVDDVKSHSLRHYKTKTRFMFYKETF